MQGLQKPFQRLRVVGHGDAQGVSDLGAVWESSYTNPQCVQSVENEIAARTEITKDDEVVVIESVKAASDILAPLDGEIVEVNSTLADNPALVNDDPTGDAWFFKMKPSDLSPMDDYMDEAAYKEFIGD